MKLSCTSTQVRACTVSAGGNKVRAEFTQTHTDTQSMFTLFEGSVVQIMRRPIIAFVWLISVVTCVSQEGRDFCKELHSKSNPVRRQTHREINSNLIKNKDENNERWKKNKSWTLFPSKPKLTTSHLACLTLYAAATWWLAIVTTLWEAEVLVEAPTTLDGARGLRIHTGCLCCKRKKNTKHDLKWSLTRKMMQEQLKVWL